MIFNKRCMLPIYLKDRDFIPPADTIYYLLTRDGLFLVKRTPFFEAVVPATGIPWLEPQGPEVRLSAPPLPATSSSRPWPFFGPFMPATKAKPWPC